MATHDGFAFSKYDLGFGYVGPTFSLQPLPGGQPQDFFHVGEEEWNTQADGLGQSLADWEAAHTDIDPETEKPIYNFYYFEMTDQRSGIHKARPLPGERPMLQYDSQEESQCLRYNAPGGLQFSFSVCETAIQEDYDT